jgi:thiol-disulfide isomerase/thioredoxin
MNEIWYFYASWCTYCKQQNPILDEFIAKHPEINVVKILEEENKDAVDHNQIDGFPTFIIFNEDSPGERLSGLHELEQLEAKFQ